MIPKLRKISVKMAAVGNPSSEHNLGAIAEEYAQCCIVLNDVFQTLRRSLGPPRGGVGSHLDLCDLPEELQMPQPILVVVGEVNSGKSTLLNKILGKIEFLPSALVSSTKVATRVQNGNTLSIFIVRRDGSQSPKYPFSEEKLTNEDLERVLTAEELTFESPELKEIVVELCGIPLLQAGVIVVDSPGLNDSRFLEECVMDYARNASCVVFAHSAHQEMTISTRKHLKKLHQSLKMKQCPILYAVTKVDKGCIGRSMRDHKEGDATYPRDVEHLIQKLCSEAQKELPFLRGKGDVWRDNPYFHAFSVFKAEKNGAQEYNAFEKKMCAMIRNSLAVCVETTWGPIRRDIMRVLNKVRALEALIDTLKALPGQLRAKKSDWAKECAEKMKPLWKNELQRAWDASVKDQLATCPLDLPLLQTHWEEFRKQILSSSLTSERVSQLRQRALRPMDTGVNVPMLTEAFFYDLLPRTVPEDFFFKLCNVIPLSVGAAVRPALILELVQKIFKSESYKALGRHRSEVEQLPGIRYLSRLTDYYDLSHNPSFDKFEEKMEGELTAIITTIQRNLKSARAEHQKYPQDTMVMLPSLLARAQHALTIRFGLPTQALAAIPVATRTNRWGEVFQMVWNNLPVDVQVVSIRQKPLSELMKEIALMEWELPVADAAAAAPSFPRMLGCVFFQGGRHLAASASRAECEGADELHVIYGQHNDQDLVLMRERLKMLFDFGLLSRHHDMIDLLSGVPLVSLTEATSAIRVLPDLVQMNFDDTLRKCFEKARSLAAPIAVRPGCPALTEDEIAALVLYTAPSPFYSVLNSILRTPGETRLDALEIWKPYLVLFRQAMRKKEPASVARTLYRGLTREPDGMREKFKKDREVCWWSVGSASTELQTAKNFATDYGQQPSGGVIIMIQKTIEGYSLQDVSLINWEREIVFLPGAKFRSMNDPYEDPGDGLWRVELEQIPSELGF